MFFTLVIEKYGKQTGSVVSGREKKGGMFFTYFFNQRDTYQKFPASPILSEVSSAVFIDNIMLCFLQRVFCVDCEDKFK